MKGDRKRPRARRGWIELEPGHWLRASTVVAVEAVNQPEEPDGTESITAVTAAGEEWDSVYTTGAVLDAIAAAEAEGGGRDG